MVRWEGHPERRQSYFWGSKRRHPAGSTRISLRYARVSNSWYINLDSTDLQQCCESISGKHSRRCLISRSQIIYINSKRVEFIRRNLNRIYINPDYIPLGSICISDSKTCKYDAWLHKNPYVSYQLFSSRRFQNQRHRRQSCRRQSNDRSFSPRLRQMPATII